MLSTLNEMSGKEGGLLNTLPHHESMLVFSNKSWEDSAKPSKKYPRGDFVQRLKHADWPIV
jgi:hypothetical protein